LISSNAIVTAAHCIHNKNDQHVRQANEIIVKLGKFDLSIDNEIGSLETKPKKIILHPNWNSTAYEYDSDIAMIILENKVPDRSKTIFPICLWEKRAEPIENSGVVVGWGESESSIGGHELKPRQLEVFIRTNEDCFLKNHRFALISSKNTFCAGKNMHSGPCRGDSGSGMFTRSRDGSTWFLRGLVSASFLTNGNCDISQDAIFTNVLKFVNWIKQTARNNNIQLPQPEQIEMNQRTDMSARKEIFCFFEGWAEGREGDGAFNLYDFKPELCTTAVYLLANLEGDNLKSVNPWQELEDNGGQNLYKRFTGLKQTHPHLRTLLAVGGWVDGSEKYSQLAENSIRRKRFAQNSAVFLKKYGFDGLHFHWEHPAHRGLY
jgi:hypothetical protein